MQKALDQIKHNAHATDLVLIGYSGGGAIATLLAVQRNDVALLVTIAGNLDTAQHSALHGVSPLSASLNPIDAAPRLGTTRQIHYNGGKDRNIPPLIAQSFIRHLPTNTDVRVITIPDATHTTGWDGLDFSAVP